MLGAVDQNPAIVIAGLIAAALLCIYYGIDTARVIRRKLKQHQQQLRPAAEQQQLSFRLAGVKHKNQDGVPRYEVLQDVCDGDAVTLMPDNNNPHDRSAVRVFWRGQDIGMVPAAQSERVKNLCTNPHQCSVLRIDRNEDRTGKIWINSAWLELTY